MGCESGTPTRLDLAPWLRRSALRLGAWHARDRAHLDPDAFDPPEGCANVYAAPGGPSRADGEATPRPGGKRSDILDESVTGCDRGLDADARMLATATWLARTAAV